MKRALQSEMEQVEVVISSETQTNKHKTPYKYRTLTFKVQFIKSDATQIRCKAAQWG